MPEIWIPYGNVETLVTVQAENLGVVAQQAPEAGQADLGRVAELFKGASAVFVTDSSPATIELLKGVVASAPDARPGRIYSAAPRRVESGVPELKGSLTTMPPPLAAGEGDEPLFAQQLTEGGSKLFVGGVRPDPLFGIIDPKVQACLSWVARSRRLSAKARKSVEPEPFHKTEAYEEVEGLVEKIPESKFLAVVPRGGRLRTVLEDAPFDAIKNSFSKTPMPQARGLVVGAGGRSYDDTLSGALRGVWGALPGVRKTGTVLLIAECSEGIGSAALEMLVSGRLQAGEERKKEGYIDGAEEIFYLNKLKDEYDVMLLSGLPETYAGAKLGLTTAKGSGEAVGRVLNKVGRSGKLNVVARAPECLAEPA
jgi:hypothetical protein